MTTFQKKPDGSYTMTSTHSTTTWEDRIEEAAARRYSDEELEKLEALLRNPREQNELQPPKDVLPLVVELRAHRRRRGEPRRPFRIRKDGTVDDLESLYVEPQWLTNATAWLADFRRAVEAAALEWVAPTLGFIEEERWLWEWQAPRMIGDPEVLYSADLDFLLGFGATPVTNLPACVELYRRWLEARKGAK